MPARRRESTVHLLARLLCGRRCGLGAGEPRRQRSVVGKHRRRRLESSGLYRGSTPGGLRSRTDEARRRAHDALMPIIGMHIRIGQAVQILVQLFWNGIVTNIGHANDNVTTYIYTSSRRFDSCVAGSFFTRTCLKSWG